MDVRFCSEQEPPAERPTCAATDPDRASNALSRARTEDSFFLLTKTYMDAGDTPETRGLPVQKFSMSDSAMMYRLRILGGFCAVTQRPLGTI